MSAGAATVSEADVILPPPSRLNPIPSLPAALRLDNQEQLLGLLLQFPSASGSSSNTNLNSSSPANTPGVFRQLLLFGNESLRTLLLRQVLSDPHQRHTQNQKQTKKNWDHYRSFPFPRSLQANIVSTGLLRVNAISTTSGTHSSSVITEDDDSASRSTNPFDDEEPTGIMNQHVDVITYFLRPWLVEQTQAAIASIKSYGKKMSKKKQPAVHHRIVYIPSCPAWIHQVLVDSGLAAAPNVSIQNLQLDLFPLETDVISLEYENALIDEGVYSTPSLLVTTCARSILKLQDIVGKIPRIQSIGKLSEEVLAKTLNQSVDEYLTQDLTNSGNITDGTVEPTATFDDEETPTPLPPREIALFLMDRKVDMVTPMVTPLTYEGLLNEIVGIDCGFIKVNVQTINPDDHHGDEKKHQSKDSKVDDSDIVMLGVHAGDSLYAEVRDQHVEKFGSFLQNQALALKESHANFTNKGAKKDLSEIHQFVKQIPMFTQNLRSLTNHIHLAELIKATTEETSFREQWQTERSMMEGEICYDVLEEWICSGYPADKILRLLCLQSLCAGGLKASRYDSFRAQVVQIYGYEFLVVLHGLEKMGWIRRKETFFMDNANSSPFGILRRTLILINAEVDTVDPDDVSYVSSGYAPLSVRLIQASMQGWTSSKDDILKELPGRLLDITQSFPPQDLTTTLQQIPAPTDSLGEYAKAQQRGGKTKPTLLVFYLGGITYMEIAALRFLSKRESFPYHIIMVTTKVINGSSLMNPNGM